MAISLLTCKWSLQKKLLAEQVEGIRGLIRRKRIQVKFSWIPRSNYAIADHLTHQVFAAGENLVLWAGGEERATSAMVQAVSAVKAYWTYGRFTTMHNKLPMICEEFFHTNIKKGYSDPIEDVPLLYFLHTH